ncbi:MAG: glycosyltransferase family 2 protein [Acidobacteriota bacterium]
MLWAALEVLGLSLVALGCAMRVLWALRGARNARSVPTLREEAEGLGDLVESLATSQPAGDGPRLVAVVPARDEEAAIEAALRTFLDQDLQGMEVVVVNDRSSDGTGALLAALAQEEPRLTVVEVDHLPEGWLGKVHALEQGCRTTVAQEADYLLFADADVHLAPGALRRSVALCEARGLDHLTLLPDLRAGTFLQSVVLWVFGALLLGRYDLSAAGSEQAEARETKSQGKKKRSQAVGVGAFNLVRRSAFDDTPGFKHLRLEVVDDVALGQMMAKSGHRTAARLAPEDVYLDWYGSLPAMIRGLEKNAFAAAAFSLPRLAVAVIMCTLLSLSPLAALILGIPQALAGTPCTFLALAVLVALTHAYSAQIYHQRLQAPRLPALFTAAGLLLCAFIALRSAVLTLRRGGIRWRETFYPLADLREGRRVEL